MERGLAVRGMAMGQLSRIRSLHEEPKAHQTLNPSATTCQLSKTKSCQAPPLSPSLKRGTKTGLGQMTRGVCEMTLAACSL